MTQSLFPEIEEFQKEFKIPHIKPADPDVVENERHIPLEKFYEVVDCLRDGISPSETSELIHVGVETVQRIYDGCHFWQIGEFDGMPNDLVVCPECENKVRMPCPECSEIERLLGGKVELSIQLFNDDLQRYHEIRQRYLVQGPYEPNPQE